MANRVVHYSNQLGLGGTEGTLEIMCRILDTSRFEVWVVTRAAPAHCGPNVRMPALEESLGRGRVVLAKSDEDLRRVILELQPTILHVHYSGAAEPPTSDEIVMRQVPVVVT